MNKLQEILNRGKVEDITAEVAVSERFTDEEGKIVKFKVKPLTSKHLNEIRMKATITDKKGRRTVNEEQVTSSIAIDCTVEPSFRSSEGMNAVGCSTPENYLNAVLLAGEIDTLTKEILRLSGFGNTIDELVDEVKN